MTHSSLSTTILPASYPDNISRSTPGVSLPQSIPDISVKSLDAKNIFAESIHKLGIPGLTPMIVGKLVDTYYPYVAMENRKNSFEDSITRVLQVYRTSICATIDTLVKNMTEDEAAKNTASINQAMGDLIELWKNGNDDLTEEQKDRIGELIQFGYQKKYHLDDTQLTTLTMQKGWMFNHCMNPEKIGRWMVYWHSSWKNSVQGVDTILEDILNYMRSPETTERLTALLRKIRDNKGAMHFYGQAPRVGAVPPHYYYLIPMSDEEVERISGYGYDYQNHTHIDRDGHKIEYSILQDIGNRTLNYNNGFTMEEIEFLNRYQSTVPSGSEAAKSARILKRLRKVDPSFTPKKGQGYLLTDDDRI